MNYLFEIDFCTQNVNSIVATRARLGCFNLGRKKIKEINASKH